MLSGIVHYGAIQNGIHGELQMGRLVNINLSCIFHCKQNTLYSMSKVEVHHNLALPVVLQPNLGDSLRNL